MALVTKKKTLVPEIDSPVVRGDSWLFQLTIEVNGAPKTDIGTSVWKADLRNGPTRDYNLIASIDIDLSQAANGLVILSLPKETTAKFIEDKYYTDVQETLPNSQDKTHVKITLLNEQDVTI